MADRIAAGTSRLRPGRREMRLATAPASAIIPAQNGAPALVPSDGMIAAWPPAPGITAMPLSGCRMANVA
jgi:hypothetical protein